MLECTCNHTPLKVNGLKKYTNLVLEWFAVFFLIIFCLCSLIFKFHIDCAIIQRHTLIPQMSTLRNMTLFRALQMDDFDNHVDREYQVDVPRPVFILNTIREGNNNSLWGTYDPNDWAPGPGMLPDDPNYIPPGIFPDDTSNESNEDEEVDNEHEQDEEEEEEDGEEEEDEEGDAPPPSD